jgi:hypothetical protein
VIQVGGRKQLGMSFGSGSSPDCRGFTLEEINKIDWDKVDFAEFIEDLKVKFGGGYKAPSAGDLKATIEGSLSSIDGFDSNLSVAGSVDSKSFDPNNPSNRGGFSGAIKDDSWETLEEKRLEDAKKERVRLARLEAERLERQRIERIKEEKRRLAALETERLEKIRLADLERKRQIERDERIARVRQELKPLIVKKENWLKKEKQKMLKYQRWWFDSSEVHWVIEDSFYYMEAHEEMNEKQRLKMSWHERYFMQGKLYHRIRNHKYQRLLAQNIAISKEIDELKIRYKKGY